MYLYYLSNGAGQKNRPSTKQLAHQLPHLRIDSADQVFSLPLSEDQAGVHQFLHVMRNRGTADLQRTDHLRKRAPRPDFKIGLLALEDLRIDLEPIRIGQGVEQSRQLSVGVLHSSIIIEASRYVN